MSKVLYTDTELLDGLASGNRDAVKALYNAYHPLLVKWMLSRGGIEADAEDVFQEALVILYEKAQAPEFCLTCKLSTYLFAVSKHLWYKKLQQSGLFFSLNEQENESELEFGQTYMDDIQSHWDKELQFDQLSKSLDQLGEPCSTLLKAFYIDKKNMQEIAKAFGYTNAENAKTQKYKCLTRLRKIFFARSPAKAADHQ